MPWVRFADDYLSNTKVASLGPLARLLDVAAIIYSARELRDGQLTRVDVQLIATLAHIPRWQPAAAELVGVGRWIQDDGGYTIHDYLAYQPSREEVLAQREQVHSNKVAAGRAGGLATAQRRGKQNASSTASRTAAAPPAELRQDGSRTAAPYPVPDPVDDPVVVVVGSSPGRAGVRQTGDLPAEVRERLSQPPIPERRRNNNDNNHIPSGSQETTGC